MGNFANSFIIVYYNRKIYMIDQHAASEKSLYISYLSKNVRRPVSYQSTVYVENLFKEVLEEHSVKM